MFRKSLIFITIIIVTLFLFCVEKGRDKVGVDKKDLVNGFLSPPMSAKPRAYWAWMNGNVSLSQLTRDLEEMKDKGLSGLDIFDIGAMDPDSVVPKGTEFMGDESIEAICYAIREATRLGLELGFIASSSWNAGGSWITPENATMGLYNSETIVEGPIKFSNVLPFPNVSKECPKGQDGLPVYYKNIAVLAYPKSGDRLIKDASSVIDLTKNLDEKGLLNWDVPEGEWVIMRFVCTNTGQRLVLPSPKSSGYNIDHFSPVATEVHFQYLIDKLSKELGSFEGTALKFMYLCSYELRGLVWTPTLIEEFQKRRGYDMTPYLPVLLGLTVKDKEITERFKFDFNMTLSDLIIENHYTKARKILNKYGLLLCSEAGGPGQPLHNCPFEALRALGALDIPRGEYWNQHHFYDENGIDVLWLVKEIACASHIYGKKIVDGESFTSWFHWQEGPSDLKPLADKAMCEGLNRFTFHTGAHNPPEAGKPGWAYHAGTHINVNRVWWPKIKPFVDYLARCCYLLQEGHFVGDVCYYYGDQAPNFVKPKHIDPSLGYGYDYDVTNSEVILTRISTKNSRIVLPDGMSYELLVLPDREDMNLEVLQKIEELVKAGATVVGRKPTRANGLTDYPNMDEKVRKLADEVWGDCDGEKVKERSFGRGKIIWGKMLREILTERGIRPDFSFTGVNKETDLDYIHRRVGGNDIYFVVNKKDSWEEADCVFRINGKVPEIWYPDTGEMRECAVFDFVDGGTRVPLRLGPYGSVFVVFSDKAKRERIVSVKRNGNQVFPVSNEVSEEFPFVEVKSDDNNIEVLIWKEGEYVLGTSRDKSKEIKVDKIPSSYEITGSWDVRFPFGWGAPASKVFPNLISWSDDKDDGVKYFSGIATYYKEFDISEELKSVDNHIILDLGKVKVLCDVYLNGKHIGILWKTPFRVDITDAVKVGKNHLVVEVANTWSNRIVGDSKLPKGRRFTNTNIRSPKSSNLIWKDAPLLESGLIGPVKLVIGKKMRMKL
jgi:hypothetical protein